MGEARYRPKNKGNLLVHDGFDTAVEAAEDMRLDPSLWGCAGIGQQLTGFVFENIVIHPQCLRATPSVIERLGVRLMSGGRIIKGRKIVAA